MRSRLCLGPRLCRSVGADAASPALAVVAVSDLQCTSPAARQCAAGQTRAGWPLVAAGPERMQAILVDQLKTCVRKNGHPSARNAFGMFYGWLFASSRSKNPGPIRNTVRESIIDNVRLAPGQMLSGKPVERPRPASIVSTPKAEGLHPKTLTNVLWLSGLISDTSQMKGAPNVVADYESARTLVDTTKYAIPAIRIPVMLTASGPLVAALLDGVGSHWAEAPLSYEDAACWRHFLKLSMAILTCVNGRNFRLRSLVVQ